MYCKMNFLSKWFQLHWLTLSIFNLLVMIKVTDPEQAMSDKKTNFYYFYIQ